MTIVIANFNYQAFLGEAIESAMHQTHSPLEVIVVDDGSTDGSRAVIDTYGDRLRSIFKENGGQASAYGAGFRASRGTVVIFLDADDLLFPDTVERVVEVFRRDAAIVKVHYRLALVDATGRPTGQLVPPRRLLLPQGDVRRRVLSSPADVPHPPGSGNAYAASALRRVLPIPEEVGHLPADMYLLNLVSLLGHVASLSDVGGVYRVHGGNSFHRDALDLDQVRTTIRSSAITHARLAELASSLGLWRAPRRLRSVTDLAQRLISLKLEPERHPLRDDRVLSLAVAGAATAARSISRSPRHGILYAAWFLATAAAPRPAAAWSAKRLFAAWKADEVFSGRPI